MSKVELKNKEEVLQFAYDIVQAYTEKRYSTIIRSPVPSPGEKFGPVIASLHRVNSAKSTDLKACYRLFRDILSQAIEFIEENS